MKFSVVALLSVLSFGSQVLAAPIAAPAETVAKAKGPTKHNVAVSPLLTRLSQLEDGCRGDLEKISTTKEKDSRGSHVDEISGHYDSLLKKLTDGARDIESIARGHDEDGKELTAEELHILLINVDIVQTVVGNSTSTCDDANNKYSAATRAKLAQKIAAVKNAARSVVTPIVTYATKVANTCTGPPELVSSLKAGIRDTQRLKGRWTVDEEVHFDDAE